MGLYKMRDAPEIARMERFGGPAEEEPRCPVCGRVCEDVYVDEAEETAGCDRCLRRVDAWKRRTEERRGLE